MPSLGIGAVVGLAVFGAGLLVLRRLHRSGRRLRVPPSEIPAPSAMDQAQRDAVQLAWPPLAALAVAAIAMGVWIGGGLARHRPRRPRLRHRPAGGVEPAGGPLDGRRGHPPAPRRGGGDRVDRARLLAHRRPRRRRHLPRPRRPRAGGPDHPGGHRRGGGGPGGLALPRRARPAGQLDRRARGGGALARASAGPASRGWLRLVLPAVRHGASWTAPSPPRGSARAAARATRAGPARPPRRSSRARPLGADRSRRGAARPADVRGWSRPPEPSPAAAITSDHRDGFYLWWVFARGATPEAAFEALAAGGAPDLERIRAVIRVARRGRRRAAGRGDAPRTSWREPEEAPGVAGLFRGPGPPCPPQVLARMPDLWPGVPRPAGEVHRRRRPGRGARARWSVRATRHRRRAEVCFVHVWRNARRLRGRLECHTDTHLSQFVRDTPSRSGARRRRSGNLDLALRLYECQERGRAPGPRRSGRGGSAHTRPREGR